MPEIDREDVIDGMAAGENASKIAARLGVSVKQAKAVMHEAISDMSDAEVLRQEWYLEDHRLKLLGLKFFEIAMRDNDPQSAVVFLKGSERRATLNGANKPQSYIVHTTGQAPAAKTSTQEIAEVLDVFLGATANVTCAAPRISPTTSGPSCSPWKMRVRRSASANFEKSASGG